MDKGEITMNATTFRSSVEKKIAGFLLREGFVFQEEKVCGREDEVKIFYRSNFCKLSIYKSTRGGEVNVMLGGINSPNTNRPDDGWKYLNSLVHDKNNSIDELLQNVPEVPKSFDDQLDEVVDKLTLNYNLILNNINQY